MMPYAFSLVLSGRCRRIIIDTIPSGQEEPPAEQANNAGPHKYIGNGFAVKVKIMQRVKYGFHTVLPYS
jgi:hypothetical protein